jgi:hypothetical protein
MLYTDNLATDGLSPGHASHWSIAVLGVWELHGQNEIAGVESGSDSANIVGEVYKGFMLRPREAQWLSEIALIHGLAGKLTVTDLTRTNGDLHQAITDTTISTVTHSTLPLTSDLILKLAQVHGLVDPLEVINVSPDVVRRSAGPLIQNILQIGTTITVENA